MELFIKIIGVGLFALIPAFIAKKKDRDFWGYYFLSFVISPLITTIITLFLYDMSDVKELEDSYVINEKQKLIYGNKPARRGGFRIIIGAVMIIFQIGGLIATKGMMEYDVGFVGMYGVGIGGVALLAYGIRAYKKEFGSQIILHTQSNKIHIGIKWIIFVFTTFVLAYYLYSLIRWGLFYDFYEFFIIIAAFSFAIYLLFYVYKKPTCLFSATLIFTGLAYFPLSLTLISVSRMIVGILYIIIASKLYTEKFSVKAISIMGWIALGMELYNRVLYNIELLPSFPSYYVKNLVVFLFDICLFFYISVFKINTDRPTFAIHNTNTIKFCPKCGTEIIADAALAFTENANVIKFCRKCGTEITQNATLPVSENEN